MLLLIYQQGVGTGEFIPQRDANIRPTKPTKEYTKTDLNSKGAQNWGHANAYPLYQLPVATIGLKVTGQALLVVSPWEAERRKLDPNLEHLIRQGFVSMPPRQNTGFSFIAGILWQLIERKEDEPIGGMRPQWNSVRYRWAAIEAEESELTAGHVVQNDNERLFLGSSLIGLVPGRVMKEMIGCLQRGHGIAPAGLTDV
jgi:hypothetical protein